MSALRPRAEPAQLPIEGGHERATVTLRPLLSAVFRGAPEPYFHRAAGATAALKALGVGAPRIDVPVIAFALEHPTGGTVLVDTGFDRAVAAGPPAERARNLGRVGRVLARTVEMSPEQAVAAQLRAAGTDPADVRLVVMTHLHFDHASALRDFPNATVLAGAPEWDAARARNAWLHGYVAAQLDPRPDYRLLDFTSPAARPLGPFDRTLDLFGDGTITLVSTPGHTHGHLSLIVRLGGREALLTGDAAYTVQTLRGDARPWHAEDRRAFEDSLLRLRRWDIEHPDALVIVGHDMEAWSQLAASYS